MLFNLVLLVLVYKLNSLHLRNKTLISFFECLLGGGLHSPSAFPVHSVSVYSLSLSQQGDKADCFYIVESGEVKIMMKSKVSCPFPLHFSVSAMCC